MASFSSYPFFIPDAFAAKYIISKRNWQAYFFRFRVARYGFKVQGSRFRVQRFRAVVSGRWFLAD
jgi:hypothetical protein